MTLKKFVKLYETIMKDNVNVQLAKLEATEFNSNFIDENNKRYVGNIGKPISTVLDSLNDTYNNFINDNFPDYLLHLHLLKTHHPLVRTFCNGYSKLVFRDYLDDSNYFRKIKVYKVYKTKNAFEREKQLYSIIKEKYPDQIILADTIWYNGWTEQQWAEGIDYIPLHLEKFILDGMYPGNFGITRDNNEVIIDWENINVHTLETTFDKIYK